MNQPRILTIMGSGETSPTMVKAHRELFARLGPPPVPAVLLDTPFGFQENADDLTARAQEYFRESVSQELGVASFRSAAATDALAYETMLTRLREARYVFAGPGSPTYALRQWSGSLVPAILAEKLATGGCVVFASAAALTLGRVTVPVYEIYKVGEAPHWLDGLDLLAQAGFTAAVIPHFNNAEGGTHDTRFCYLGERRLQIMEDQLVTVDPSAFVLGVDEHTGIVFDLDASTASVVGLGVVTVRVSGRAIEVPAGTVVPIAHLPQLADQLRRGEPAPAASGPSQSPAAWSAEGRPPTSPGGVALSPLLAAIQEREAEFDTALARRDGPGAVRAVLGLEDDLHAWSRDSLQSDEADRGRAVLRGMIVRLGEAARAGLRDPTEVIGPFVDALLDMRRTAREDKRWNDADAVRDRLVALGVEVHDRPDGTGWELGPSS